MFPKIFPNAFRKIVKACSDLKQDSDFRARNDMKACSDVAASSARFNVGFSPGCNSVRAMRSSPLHAKKVLAATLFGIAFLLLPVASSFRALAQKPAQAKATADLPAGPMQAKATTACLECHEGRIILQQRLSKAAWTKEVDKMIKWGAVVDPADRGAVVDYLSANFSPDKPAYEPPSTAAKGRKILK